MQTSTQHFLLNLDSSKPPKVVCYFVKHVSKTVVFLQLISFQILDDEDLQHFRENQVLFSNFKLHYILLKRVLGNYILNIYLSANYSFWTLNCMLIAIDQNVL